MGIFSKIKTALFGPQVDYAELVLDGAKIIDVRSPEEFSMGHSVGARNIPLDKLGSQANSLKGSVVILVCQSGMRASRAQAQLKAKGITAYNAGSWTKLA